MTASFRPLLLFLSILFLLSLQAGPVAHAQDAARDPSQDPTQDDRSPHSEATLLSEMRTIAPGEPFTVALQMQMDDGWHSYWKNPGDSGEPTSLNWDLPDGFEAGAIQWPYPERIDLQMLTSYGYSNQVTLLTTLTPPADLQPGITVQLSATATWLICADICLPAEGDVEASVDVAEAPVRGPEASIIDAARTHLPVTPGDWTVQATNSTGSYTLALTSPNGQRPDLSGTQFFPADGSVLDHAAPQSVSQSEGRTLLAMQQSPYAQAPVDTLRGVVVAPEGTSFRAGEDARAMTVAVPVDSVLTATSPGGGTTVSLPWALLLAFAGGLLLNLMPCVFPVLSVKILGFAEQSGGEASTIRTHGLLFGAGVLVSMWVLAGALLLLRAAGTEVGWGFQLQSPTFIALMTLLFTGIGLNLLGVFEVGTRVMNWGGRLQTATPDGGKTGAFLTGVLATVVATPCTAPFMGAALGAALALPVAGALSIFTALGVGMAVPYVGLALAPTLLQSLPKPGRWMETLKQLFAFPMFATAIWLVWVFGQQTSNNGVALLLFGVLLLSLAGWIVHRWPIPQLSSLIRWGARGAVAVMVGGAVAAALLGAQSVAAPSTSAADASAETSSESTQWQSYSRSTVESLRAEGRPVFVDFTAAWCLTCQVNKRGVLNTESVQDAFRERNVALVKADWTNRDPEITKALQDLGRSGVPVYVLYPGDGSGPTLLPEVLTESIVLDALRDVPRAVQTADRSSERSSSDSAL